MIIKKLMQRLSMARQTIAEVSATLKEHLARCEEQHKTLFNTVEDLKNDINMLNKKMDTMLYALCGFLATTMVAVLISIFTI